MKKASNIVLRILGILLLTAAILKGWKLLTEPVANSDIWSYRPFLILTVEFELALSIWLLSGLLKNAAWLVSLLCFIFFSMITFHKAVTGAASCGCFGSVHVNPWITFFAIDLPIVIVLAIFYPQARLERPAALPRIRMGISIIVLVIIGVPMYVALVKYVPIPSPASELIPDVDTFRNRYEVLEPESWIGRTFPLFEYIDIGQGFRKGKWLIVLHRHYCPQCKEALQHFQHAVEDFSVRDITIAFVAIPPYGPDIIPENPMCRIGQLARVKRWIVTAPTIVALEEGIVVFSMEGKTPSPHTLLKCLSERKTAGTDPVRQPPDRRVLYCDGHLYGMQTQSSCQRAGNYNPLSVRKEVSIMD